MKVDDTDFLKGMKRLDAHAKRWVVEAMNDNRLDLEKQAVLLAPLDEGTLSRSRTSTQPKWRGHMLESRVGFNVEYATEVHETMYPAMGVSMGRSGAMVSGRQPGPLTRAKPPTRFGPAGGKYLERPLIGNRKKYTNHIAKHLRKNLGR